MEQLISAAEKRKRYDSATDANSRAELHLLTERINNARGTAIGLDSEPSPPVLEILKSKGYKCAWVMTGYNESEYQISW